MRQGLPWAQPPKANVQGGDNAAHGESIARQLSRQGNRTGLLNVIAIALISGVFTSGVHRCQDQDSRTELTFRLRL